MKLPSLFLIAGLSAFVASCGKPQSEAEKNAQIDREVQQRVAAERQADEQQRLAQQQAELAARERALGEKEAEPSPTAAAATPRVTTQMESRDSASESEETRSYDTFYRKLEPYGAWRESSDYGYVWQPREAQRRDWRPYTDGRWAYTDAGWTWVSDEPFGWATYHYGRWTRLSGVGWVWVPGEEWAPAWVSWRTSNQHVGWAPLPPEAQFERRTGIKRWADSYYDIDAGEYVFIPNEEIGAENVQRAVIPQDRNIVIVNETTNVTNITYNNTIIVNEGPDFNELRSRSRQPLPRLRLEREFNVEGNQAPRAVVRGETIAMMTPIFSARAVQRPQTVGAPIGRATVERPAANQPEAAKARAKMRSEATPPPDAPPKRFEKPAIAPGGSAASPAATATQKTPGTSTPPPSPSLTPRPSRAPVAPSTPAASGSPTLAASPTRAATVKPVATTMPTATPNASRPRSATTASPAPGSTASSATPVATAIATVTPSPVATRPSVAATPAPAVVTTPASTPRSAPTPGGTTFGTPVPGSTPTAQPSAAEASASQGSDDMRGADRAARKAARRERREQEVQDAKIRELSRGGKNIPAPGITPGQVPPAAAAETALSPAAATPAVEATARPIRRLPPTAPERTATPPAAQSASSPVASIPTAISATPTPTPSPSSAVTKARNRPLKPKKDKDVAEPPESPEDANQP